jgi:DNA-binding transcriptional LysR family regulator
MLRLIKMHKCIYIIYVFAYYKNVQTSPNIYLLQTLAVLNEEGNLVKTAERLKLTQPTVTRHLQQLQDWAVQPLFEMKGRRKALTSYGLEIAFLFQQRLAGLESSLAEVQKKHLKADSQRLRIIARPGILERYFATVGFEGTLDLIPGGSHEIREQIARQSCDMAIAYEQLNTSAYVAKDLFVSKTVLLVPKAWSPAKISAKQFCEKFYDRPFATHSDRLPFLKEFMANFEIIAPPKVSVMVSNWSIIEERVNRQLAWSLVPSPYVRDHRQYWVIDLPEMSEQLFFLYYKKSLSRMDWFRKFMDDFKDELP